MTDDIPFKIAVDNTRIQTLLPGFSFETHLHHTAELFVCLSGELTINIFNKELVVKPGEYFICFPDVPHCGKVTSKTLCAILQIHFYCSLLSQYAADNLDTGEFAFVLETALGTRKYLKADCSSQLEACIRGIHLEKSAHAADSELLIRHYLAQLNVFLCREINSDRCSVLVNENPHLLASVLYINEHYREKITVQNVADAAGIAPRSLTKMYNESFDVGVCAYITYVRITKAIDFIYFHPEYSLSKIALDVGFSSQQHFSKAFKEQMSVSPGRYFKLLKPNT